MKNTKKLISVIAPCFNEQDNIDELYQRINAICATLEKYDFEILFIDNASTDITQDKLRNLAGEDKRVKVIINTRNFGHVRSPYWGLLQTSGDASIYLASDLQDPPEMIPQFIDAWEAGYSVVMAIKPVSQNSFISTHLRRGYYKLLDDISDFSHTKDATGFGLYDKKVLDIVRKIKDPYPYFRGMVAELGFDVKIIPFDQPRRLKGISKNNFFTLYDVAMLGIVSHSKVPIRLAAFFGLAIGLISLLTSVFFLGMKLAFWDSFAIGIAPIVIGLFFLLGLQFIFIGLLGEYVGSIHTYLQNRPVVVEKERINFDE